MNSNLDKTTVDSFGDEWERFDQTELSKEEVNKIFDEYFAVFPWEILPANPSGFDMGCGSGRWAKIMATRVGHLHCIDPSSALDVAKRTMKELSNVSFHQGGVADSVLPPGSQDFGYSLGVLHHIPDTASALKDCVKMLKPGAPFLVYLYYAFDNRSRGFKFIWKVSDIFRRLICKLPPAIKGGATDFLALVVYFPFAKFAWLSERVGLPVHNFPLAYYRNHSFYTMRTDSRDRFGTPLEQRFSKKQIANMLASAGLDDIRFSSQAPYWCAAGIKK